MRRCGNLGDNYTYPFILKACGVTCGLLEGRQVHGEIFKCGFGCNLYVVNGLISMYWRCGELGLARVVFDEFYCKDTVSWNTMIRGYVRFSDMAEAQKLFDEMPERDVASWSIMLDGYVKKTGDLNRARFLFDCMPTRDSISWNTMMHAYAKVGDLVSVRQLFDDIPKKTVVSWTIMIDGHVQHGDPMEALNLFRKMLSVGTNPDMVSVVGALLACAQLGSLDQGKWIHIYMERNKITMDLVVQTALVDMYMKCGSLDEALRVFSHMSKRSVISWNVVIRGLGINGFGNEALEYFARMEIEGVPIDDIIFLSVLTACSHAGLVTEGIRVFDRMVEVHKIEPKVEHYGCLVDLFGRAGDLDNARSIIDSMPLKPDSALWGSLLMACKKHRNVALAEDVLERVAELEGDDCGIYVIMSNVYANVGLWGDVQRVRSMMRERAMVKEVGKSVIEVCGAIEQFNSGDMPNVKVEEITTVLWSLLNMIMVP